MRTDEAATRLHQLAREHHVNPVAAERTARDLADARGEAFHLIADALGQQLEAGVDLASCEAVETYRYARSAAERGA